MIIQESLPPQALNLGQILQSASSQAGETRQRLITYFDNGIDEYYSYPGTLTLVMCREIRKAVQVASALALHTALKYQESNVLLINTYAGGELLISGFVQALHMLQIKVPWTFQKYLPKATREDFDDSIELPSPGNLHVLDFPTSTLTAATLEQAVHRHQAKIVILNSLEFAAFTDRRRKDLAETILALRNKLDLSVFVFSHEMRMSGPYTGGRGAMGLLSAFAASVWYILHEWERKTWVNRFKIEGENEYEKNNHTSNRDGRD